MPDPAVSSGGPGDDRLAGTMALVRDLSRVADPDELYHLFARRVADLFPVGRLLVLSRDGLDHSSVRVTRYNLWPDPPSPSREPNRLPVVTGGLLVGLANALEPRVIDDLCVPAADPAAEYLSGQRSMLAVPLFEAGSVTATLVCARAEAAAFDRSQLADVVWVCNLFARMSRALGTAAGLREQVAAADYERRAIADLQRELLPATVPQVPGLDLAVHYRAADQAGGDLYDFFPLSDGRLGVLVADSSGHGTPAAVLMAVTHSLAHTVPEPPAHPGRFLSYLNAHLGRRYTRASGSFVTAFYAVFDPAAGTVTYAGAGHPPARVCPAGAADWRPLPGPNRLPLGVNPRAAAYPELVSRFGPGDRLAVATDGILDTTDPAGSLFGPDRLDTALARGPADAGGQILAVLDALTLFAGGSPAADDRTLLVVRHAGP